MYLAVPTTDSILTTERLRNQYLLYSGRGSETKADRDQISNSLIKGSLVMQCQTDEVLNTASSCLLGAVLLTVWEGNMYREAMQICTCEFHLELINMFYLNLAVSIINR
jgi:hypothetical protein